MRFFRLLAVSASLLLNSGCSNFQACNFPLSVSGDGAGGALTPAPLTFVSVSPPLNDGPLLIDLEFLPQAGGELIVIAKNGTVYYLTREFVPLAQTAFLEVEDEGEQGLLNVVADPDYASNRLVYFFYTSPVVDGQPRPTANKVDRMTVVADVGAGIFSLEDRQTIIEFPKSVVPAPKIIHNGGGLTFDEDGNLLISVGEAGEESESQNGGSRLGKVLRIVPVRDAGQGGFTVPAGGNHGVTGLLPEIYALGFRNPFSLLVDGDRAFVGDVGNSSFEEINLLLTGAENFGWPRFEGCPGEEGLQDPIWGYAHDEKAFIDDDPEAHADLDNDPQALLASGTKSHLGVHHGDPNRSIMLGIFYRGERYGEWLTNTLIYSDFYIGFVRGVRVDPQNQVTEDRHLGHLTGMTSLKMGPDGLLYAVSLFGSESVLRADLQE